MAVAVAVRVPVSVTLRHGDMKAWQELLRDSRINLGVPSPFFPEILLSRKPPESQEKRLVLEKNGSSSREVRIRWYPIIFP